MRVHLLHESVAGGGRARSRIGARARVPIVPEGSWPIDATREYADTDESARVRIAPCQAARVSIESIAEHFMFQRRSDGSGRLRERMPCPRLKLRAGFRASIVSLLMFSISLPN